MTNKYAGWTVEALEAELEAIRRRIAAWEGRNLADFHAFTEALIARNLCAEVKGQVK